MEKQSEYELRVILNELGIKYINSCSENYYIKDLLKNSSKNNSKNIGRPDCIIYEPELNIIIIFECKDKNSIIKKATKEAKHYKDCVLNKNTTLNVFYCGFINKTIYKIYTSDDVEIKLSMKEFLVETLKLKNKNTNICKESMEKEIHSIHNYIRNYTKISNEDKSLFIGGILIALKNKDFCNILENSKTLDISLSIQLELKKYEISLEYIYNSLNKEHLFNLTKSIKNILDKNLKTDILNSFYSEFVKYSNTDGKTLGIVLTPEHIVKLMIKLLCINSNDTFLDLCSGTGSFLCESYCYSPKKIIGCEYQKKLFDLLRINSFLRNNKFNCINKDCFENKFENITKTAINPPYGMKDKTELDFIQKQLDSLEENGLAIAIIPISKLNFSEKRQNITNIAKIKTIILCNENLFYPNASVKVCIILLEKNKNGHNFEKDKVKFVDFRKDGFVIKRTFGLVKSEQEEYKEKEIIISNDNNWVQIDIDFEYPTIFSIEKYSLFLDYQKKLVNLQENNTIIELDQSLKNKSIEELFEIIKKPQEKIKKIEKVLVITAKNNNNGVKEISFGDKNTFSGNKIVLVTGGDGGAGMAYYQELPFKISSSTVVLSPKFNMTKETGMYIALFLQNYKKIYNRGYSWNLERIKNTIIS